MSELRYSHEIIHDILVRAGEALDNTTDTDFESYNSVITWLNRAYRIIINARQDWHWLRKDPPGTLVFLPPISIGTVNATNNSTSVSFSEAPSSSSLSGWYFRIIGGEDIFRLATHTAGATTAALDAVYTGDTVVGASYILFKLDYSLASDVISVIDPITLTRSGSDSRIWGEMRMISPADMSRNYPLEFIKAGTPEYYSFIGETKIRINRFPNVRVRAEYNYKFRPADLTVSNLTEEPVLPIERRYILGDLALAMLLDAKSDDRADLWIQVSGANLQAFVKEYDARLQRQAFGLLRMYPRQYGSTTTGVVRSTSGLRFTV